MMTTPRWPEWGGDPDRYYPWHVYTGPQGDMHAGYLLDTVIGADVVTGAPRVYEVLRCEPCLAWHVTPLPDEEALAQYYQRTFYQVDKADMVSRYERDRSWWERAVYGPILQQCKDALRLDCPEEDTVRFLDVGSGPGIALDVARQSYGWQTWGIEPNSDLCQRGWQRGHTMLAGTLDALPHGALVTLFDDRPCVDIVLAYEVLEHQRCPETFLLQCFALLEPGGVLVVVVPNDYNPLQLAACESLGVPRWWLAPPQHLFYWSPKCLQLALRRCGFQLLSMRGSYPLERFLLDGRVYVGNAAVGRQCHEQRMREECDDVAGGRWQRRAQQYTANLAHGIGREIVAMARRPAASS